MMNELNESEMLKEKTCFLCSSCATLGVSSGRAGDPREDFYHAGNNVLTDASIFFVATVRALV